MDLPVREFSASGYRSLKQIAYPMSRLDVFVGANGVGKSNLYRGLELLRGAAANTLGHGLASEGLDLAMWAGPRTHHQPAVELAVGLSAPNRLETGYRYEVEIGFPPKEASPTFELEPQIKSERLTYLGGARPVRLLERKYELHRMNRTLREADLVNVTNHDDRAELARRGFDARKIEVIPHGLTRERLASFAAVSPAAPATPRVAFVGTFDARKGGADFPEIVRRVVAGVPGCKFRLLGTQYRGSDEVMRFFPRALRPSIEVHPRFDPAELPGLLSDCSLGVFPSYFEAFGFGVLEMLAASLPVVAYDAPGPDRKSVV